MALAEFPRSYQRRARCPGCDDCRGLPPRVTFDHPNGPYRIRRKVVGQREQVVRVKTKAEALQLGAAERVQPKATSKTVAGRRTSTWTVEDFARQVYFPNRLDWSTATRKRRLSQLDNYVAVHPIAKARVANLSKLDVAQFLGWLSVQHGERTGQPLSYMTLHGVHGLLSGMLKYAAETDVRSTRFVMPQLGRFAADGRPLDMVADVVPPTDADLAAMEAWMAGDPYARTFLPLVQLQRWSGMRPSEIRAIRWSKIAIHAERGKTWIQIDARVADDSGGQLAPLKTKRSNRRIPLVPAAEAIVDQLAANRTGDSDFVFPNDDGLPWSRYPIAKAISRAAEATGLAAARRAAGIDPVTPHDLRHWFVTDRIDKGLSVDKIAPYIGDTPQTVRKVYAHWLGDISVDDDVADLS